MFFILTSTLPSSMIMFASSKLFSYTASKNSFENSSILVYLCIDFSLFHFIMFARTNCITIPLVKRMCSLLLRNYFFKNIYSPYIHLIISRRHVIGTSHRNFRLVTLLFHKLLHVRLNHKDACILTLT